MTSPSVLPGLQQLLKLQERDSAIDRLKYSREHLPAHGRLTEIQLEAGVLKSSMERAMVERDDAAAQQQALEAEVAGLEKRIAEINRRLYGDVQVAAKDAQAMSVEVQHLESRRTALEDRELEIMEVLEPVEIELQQRHGEARALAERSRAAISELTEAQGEIDQQLRAEVAERESLATAVPTHLLNEYERLRPKTDGVAVAPLMGSMCGGCHLTLSAQEVNKVRQSLDSVSHCEECGRILVP